MPPRPTHDIAGLDQRMQSLTILLKELAAIDDLEHLRLKVIPRPGWTTPAEFLLVNGIVDALTAHATSAAALKRVLIDGATKIGA